jgi:hypothetical protein
LTGYRRPSKHASDFDEDASMSDGGRRDPSYEHWVELDDDIRRRIRQDAGRASLGERRRDSLDGLLRWHSETGRPERMLGIVVDDLIGHPCRIAVPSSILPPCSQCELPEHCTRAAFDLDARVFELLDARRQLRTRRMWSIRHSAGE